MSAFAVLPASERCIIIEQVAAGRGVLPVIVENDFWVCWILARIYVTPEMATSVVFKGGTSLSKVFGVNQRFSEDADLSVTPASIGFSDTDLAEAPSATQRSKRMKALAKACETCVEERFLPALEAAVAEILGASSQQPTWLKYEIDAQAATPNLWFRYPSVLPQAGGYIAKQVKLELGALTDQQLTGNHVLKPMPADVVGDAFIDFQVPVVALELERTFWEKATILPAEFHRPASQPMRDRSARHFADMASLWQHPSRMKALAHPDLLQDVVRHKSRFFASAWASCDTAIPGTFHLAPPAHRHAELAGDLETVGPMFLQAPPSFSELLGQLAEAEGRLNARTATC